jgi:MoxR-like ATPase
VIDCGLIAQALEAYDGEEQIGSIEAADTQRIEILERFPREGWTSLRLDDYALGQADHPDNFCRWMEFRATDLGSIKGGSARKHHIYFQQEKGRWWFEQDRYDSVEEAWDAVRAGFVEALARAEAGEWESIEEIPALRGGPALLTKTLHVYFPDRVLPICSHAHLFHFLWHLGEREASESMGTLALNQLLFEGLGRCEELSGWSTKEMERLLYSSEFSPFGKDHSAEEIGDVAAFVAGTIAEYGDAGIEARREAEDQAREMLDSSAGRMDEPRLRALLKLFNTDSHKGKPYQARFAPAFVGATANGLVSNLKRANRWTERLWQGPEAKATEALEELLADHQLFPSSGTSYPTMLLYLRSPERFAVWLGSTDRGLQRLRPSYEPARAPGAGTLADYRAFCDAATELMRDYEIPPELLDAVLAAASRADAKEDRSPASAEANSWVFQANPAIFDIDRAVSEEKELTWVVRQYRTRVRKGDRVYLWRSGSEGGVIATATVLTDPEEMPGIAGSPYLRATESLSESEPRVNLRIDRVLGTPVKRTELLEHPVLQDLGVLAFANATNFEVMADQDAALRELIEAEATLEIPEVRPALAAELHLPPSMLGTILEMLLEKRQLIFYGPPGTGKTWVALQLAQEITREGGRFDVVQFHPSYSYEDFVGGFRPNEDDSQNGLRYSRVDGPLRKMAAAAAKDRAHPYVLVIDEINRGNIPKIFGELLFLLEYRHRAVSLQYWPEQPFSLPENLFLIATMNTADRSIALVDAALRRRFYFVQFSPLSGPVSEVLPRWLEDNGLSPEPALLLERLNREIASEDLAIGPSYFISKDGKEPDLERIWEREIMPLLREHFYGTTSDLGRFELAALRRLIAEPET